MSPPVRLQVKALPNAGRDEVVGWHAGALKVRARAPALEGRANAALAEFLADHLGLPRRNVTLVSGEKSRQKSFVITGLDEAELRRRLPAA
ncbi:MAG: DUF167 domain-containing protein [Verrucomicrobia bacterium]|nr:DUF167 domain-containing protein [Verrucomicrobiota bacterium]